MKHFLILILLFTTDSVYGQTDTTEIKKQNGNVSTNNLKEFFAGNTSLTPTAIFEFQTLKYQSVSLGLGAVHPPEHCDPLGRGLVLNNEFIFKNAKGDFVYSPQLSGFYDLIFIHAGVKFSYFTNFKDGGSFQLTPEVGIGYFLFFVVYSRNFEITGNEFVPVNKNNLSIKLIFPFGYFL